MDVRELLREQFKSAHRLLEGTVAELDNETLHAAPGGTANTIAANLAHITVSEDRIVSAVANEPSVYETSGFAEKLGLAPLDGPFMSEDWARGVRIDLPAFLEYARAVFARTDAAIERMTDEDMSREISLGHPGQGMPAALMLGRIAVYHVAFHTGEISAIKGTRNLKGIPF